MLICCSGGAILIYEYFFDGKKIFTAGSRNKPAVMSTHHQRLMDSSPTVFESVVMCLPSPPVPEPAVMASPITIDLNPTPPKPAVMGGAGVVVVKRGDFSRMK